MANITVKNGPSILLSKYIRYSKLFSTSCAMKNKKVPEEAIPVNQLEKYFGGRLRSFGDIYDKRPFKMTLIANKKYVWCSCGHSKSQPLCDGSHAIRALKIKNKPIFFMVDETKEYYLCNCKQSEHRPFCDGTHKKEEIQSALRNYRN